MLKVMNNNSIMIHEKITSLDLQFNYYAIKGWKINWLSLMVLN